MSAVPAADATLRLLQPPVADRSAARRRARRRARPAPVDHLPPAHRPDRARLRRPPARGAPLRPRPQRVRARLRLLPAGTAGPRRAPGAGPARRPRRRERAPGRPARARRPLRRRGARRRAAVAGHRRRRAAARAPHRERARDPRATCRRRRCGRCSPAGRRSSTAPASARDGCPSCATILTEVRRVGWASERGDVTTGFASVASVVRDHTGHPIAGLAVTFADGDVPDGLVRATQRAAARARPAGLDRVARASIGVCAAFVTAAATTVVTSGLNTLGTMYVGLSSSSVTTDASAYAAASSIALGDPVRLRVEQPAEHAREREHVVDLVGEVRAARADDRRVLGRVVRVDLGPGVGQREHDRVLRHRRDVVDP